MMADNFPVMSPAIIKPITNIPAQTSPERKRQVSYEAAIEEVSTRITTFFACLDFDQFYAIFPINSPKFRFVQTFNPEQFIAMMVQAFRTPKAEASKEEVEGIIGAKLRLEKRLRFLEYMFGLFEAAGLDDGGIVLSLTWLVKINQESCSELHARHTLNNLRPNIQTSPNHAIGPPSTGW